MRRKTEDGVGKLMNGLVGRAGYRWTKNSYLLLMTYFEINLEFYGEKGGQIDMEDRLGG